MASAASEVPCASPPGDHAHAPPAHPPRRPALTPAGQDRLQRALPVLALLAMVAVALLAWKLFPILQGYVAYQDCTASGRTDCTPHDAPAN